MSSASAENEAKLVINARQGDETAWEIIIRRHQDAVFRLAYLLLGDADEAQDVAQETFIRAFRALSGFDVERPLRPWLMRITTNLARNRQRSLARYLAALRRLIWNEPELAPSAESEHAQQARAQTLWQAVRRLEPGDQQVIYMRYFLALSEADMASALDIAPGTVKSRLHRAANRLRAVIEQDFPELQKERARGA